MIVNDDHMVVSWNRGTPQSSILIEFSLISQPSWGTPISGNLHIPICWFIRDWAYDLRWSAFSECAADCPSDSLSFTDVCLKCMNPMLHVRCHWQSCWVVDCGSPSTGKPRRESFVNKSVQQMGDEIDPVWASILVTGGVWLSMVRGCSFSKVWRPPVIASLEMSIGGFAHPCFRVSHVKCIFEQSGKFVGLASQRVRYWSNLYFNMLWLSDTEVNNYR